MIEQGRGLVVAPVEAEWPPVLDVDADVDAIEGYVPAAAGRNFALRRAHGVRRTRLRQEHLASHCLSVSDALVACDG